MPPLAVNVVVPPKHTFVAPVILGVNAPDSMMVTLVVPVQPLALVTVTW